MNHSKKFISFILFIGFMLNAQLYLKAQCTQWFVSPNQATGVCNDNNTPTDPSDDTYSAQIYVSNDEYPNNTWSSSDGSYTNEPQNLSNPFYNFGPYPISGGSVSFVVTDDQNNCSSNVTIIAPPTCSQVPITCPDYDICYELIEQDLCSATYLVNIGGNLDAYSNINLLNFTFYATGGTIDGVAFENIGGYLQGQGVQISGNNVFGGSGINGDPLTDNFFVITVSALPGECVKLNCTGGMWFGNTRCNLQASNICPDALEFCAKGNTISGTVTAPGDIYNCLNTENNGIEGATITIKGPNGENCTKTTNNSGEYECAFCTEGPFTICASADCPEPCGVTAYDLVLLREFILGKKDWTKSAGIIGDVNGMGGLTTLDLVILERAILGISQPSEDFDWCRFVSVADYESEPSPAGQNGTSSNLSDDNCITVSDPNTSTDFLRYMVGDMDGSCSDCVHGDDLGGVGIVFDQDDDGLIIRSGTTEKIYAFTLQVEVPAGTTITNIESVLPGILYQVKNNVLHIIWLDLTENNAGKDITYNDALIEIKYMGNQPYKLTSSENYLLGENSGIVSIFENKISEKRSVGSKSLTIGNMATFELPSHVLSTNIILSDMMGRIILSSKATITCDQFIPFKAVTPDGIYNLSIQYDGVTQSKKVLIINNN